MGVEVAIAPLRMWIQRESVSLRSKVAGCQTAKEEQPRLCELYISRVSRVQRHVHCSRSCMYSQGYAINIAILDRCIIIMHAMSEATTGEW